MYESTKLFSGYSTCFRQHKSESHCSFLHGYSLEFIATFRCSCLNELNWCMDFGSFGDVKKILSTDFDHTTIIAADDPELKIFSGLDLRNIINMKILNAVGCEAFAKYVYDIIYAQKFDSSGRVILYSVQCIENKTNTATYYAS